MKTALAVVLAVVGTAVCFSLLPSTGAVTGTSSQVGRYAIMHLDQERALMLDTATGAVWQYTSSDFCRSKTSPNDIRQVGLAEGCKDQEVSIPRVQEFQRVSVEGLYKTPLLARIDADIERQIRQAR